MNRFAISILTASLLGIYATNAKSATDLQGVRMFGPITYTTGSQQSQLYPCYDFYGSGPYTVTVTTTGTMENYYQNGWGNGPASVMVDGGSVSYSADCYPAGGGYGCCFPAGAQIMMADGTYRSIETIRVGDWVMGADGCQVQIQEVHRPLLADRAMMKMPDGSHFWSDEHAHWTRDSIGSEWWWSANPEAWRGEANSGLIGGLFDNDSLRDGPGFEFAHLHGWKDVQPIVADGFGPETQLYLPRTNGVGIIVNGYVVGSGVNEHNYPYSTFRWNPHAIWETVTKEALTRIIAKASTFAAKIGPMGVFA